MEIGLIFNRKSMKHSEVYASVDNASHTSEVRPLISHQVGIQAIQNRALVRICLFWKIEDQRSWANVNQPRGEVRSTLSDKDTNRIWCQSHKG